MTVPVADAPPTAATGDNETERAGFTDNIAEAVELAKVAVMVADCWDVTVVVVTLKVAEEVPMPTKTVAGN